MKQTSKWSWETLACGSALGRMEIFVGVNFFAL